MPTREEAVSDYNNNTSGERWRQGVQGKQQNYADGVANFLGVSSASIGRDDDWAAAANRQSAQDAYEQNTSGKGDQWYENYARAMQTE